MGRELICIYRRLCASTRCFPHHFTALSPQSYHVGRIAPISHLEIETGIETGCEWSRVTQLLSVELEFRP